MCFQTIFIIFLYPNWIKHLFPLTLWVFFGLNVFFFLPRWVQCFKSACFGKKVNNCFKINIIKNKKRVTLVADACLHYFSHEHQAHKVAKHRKLASPGESGEGCAYWWTMATDEETLRKEIVCTLITFWQSMFRSLNSHALSFVTLSHHTMYFSNWTRKYMYIFILTQIHFRVCCSRCRTGRNRAHLPLERLRQ